MKKILLILSCCFISINSVVNNHDKVLESLKTKVEEAKVRAKESTKASNDITKKAHRIIRQSRTLRGIKEPEPHEIKNNQSSSSNTHSLASNFLVRAVKNNASYCCITGAFAVIFCIFRSRILKYRNYLAQPTLWSSWRNDLSVNSLVSIPKETLTQWIVEDIQDHYHDGHSIKLFYKDVQAEQAQLQEIKNLYEKLDFFYMVDDQALVDVKTRLKVLGLLKDLVLMWELEEALAVQTALNSSSAPQT